TQRETQLATSAQNTHHHPLGEASGRVVSYPIVRLASCSSCPPSPAISAGSYTKIAFEHLTKGNLRFIADGRSDFNQCRRMCSQHSGSLRETHTSYVLHWRFANKLPEFSRKR